MCAYAMQCYTCIHACVSVYEKVLQDKYLVKELLSFTEISKAVSLLCHFRFLVKHCWFIGEHFIGKKNGLICASEMSNQKERQREGEHRLAVILPLFLGEQSVAKAHSVRLAGHPDLYC